MTVAGAHLSGDLQLLFLSHALSASNNSTA